MKIIYIYTAVTTIGGADRVIVEKANYFADYYNYDVYIITDSQCNRELSFPLSSKIHHIDLGIDFGQQYKYGIIKRTFLYFRMMNKYKKTLSDVLNQIKGDILITTLGRDSDFITKIHDGSIKIGEAHTTKECMRNLHQFQEKNIFYKVIGKIWTKKMEKAANNLTHLVVLNEAEKTKWNLPEKTTVIENSLPFYSERKNELNRKDIISVGRMSEEKGYDRLLSIWAIVIKKHMDWTLHIYGNGVMETQIKKWIKDKDLEKSIKLEGVYSNIYEKYMSSSIYVMTSYYEGFGMALAEAMACGIPCIAFDCPTGPRNIINNGNDGLLIEDGNISAFAAAVCNLIENDDYRRELGANAHKNIQRLSQRKIMEQWNNLFKSLIQ